MGPDFILFEGEDGCLTYINRHYVTLVKYNAEVDTTRVYVDGYGKPFEIDGNKTEEIMNLIES